MSRLTHGPARQAARMFALLWLALTAVRVDGQTLVTRPRIGLALGGGSARGLAHIGVLRWLEEHRIPVDAIAGSSIGACIGAAYATGMSAAEIEAMLKANDWDEMQAPDLPFALKSLRRKEDYRDYPIKMELGLRHGIRLQSNLNSGHRLGLLLSRFTLPYSTVSSFDDLVIPFRAVATDIDKGETVVLDHGPLGPALRASMALPGTFEPVPLEGRRLADGGILNNLPVDVAKTLGVDVVIAVSVSTTRREEASDGIGAVAKRAIAVMMNELDQPRAARADVLILPDIEGVGSSDFSDLESVERRGYDAAEAQSALLLTYALDPDAWARDRERVRERKRPRSGPLSFIAVTGVSDAAAAQIAQRIAEDLQTVPDTVRIEAQLDWVIGHGRYASAMYRRCQREGTEGLCVDFRDKSYAPPLVKFALDLNNEEKDLNLALGTRITLMDVTGSGSEWRLDASLGSTLRMGTELSQPLGGRGAMRRGAFVAPRAFYERTSENYYLDQKLQSIHDRQRASVGLDVGWLVDRKTQFRAGYETAYVREVARVGSAFTPLKGHEQEAHVSFSYEGQDRAYFPTRGVRLTATSSWFLDAPGAPPGFGRAEARVSSTWSTTHHQHVTTYGEGGASFGGATPVSYQFSLGGPYRLGAFAPHSLRGSNYLLAGVGYRAQLKRLPGLLGDRLYLAALVEFGSAFERLDGAVYEYSVTGGLAADTFFGPFFAGASVGRSGMVRAYFIVGRVVR
jgi:NTE family protein